MPYHIKAIVIMVLSGSLCAFQAGYQEVPFFVSPEELSEIVATNGVLPEGGSLTESGGELYSMLELKHDFAYFSPLSGQFTDFHFGQDIPKLKKVSTNSIQHLTRRNANDYLIQTSAPSEDKAFPEWEHKFIFYKYQDTYKLFAVVLTYIGENDPANEHLLINRYYFKNHIEKFRKKYGEPHRRRLVSVDDLNDKTYWFYGHTLKSSGGRYEIDGEVFGFDIDVQVVLSYVEYTGQYANLQITYLTSDYFEDTYTQLTKGLYEDIASSKELIDF